MPLLRQVLALPPNYQFRSLETFRQPAWTAMEQTHKAMGETQISHKELLITPTKGNLMTGQIILRAQSAAATSLSPGQSLRL